MLRALHRNLAKLAAVRFFLWMHLFAAVIVPFFRDWAGSASRRSSRHIPSERRATVLSAVSAARTLGVAVLYPLFGFVVDRSLPLSLAVLGAVGFVAAIVTAAPAAALERPPEASRAPSP